MVRQPERPQTRSCRGDESAVVAGMPTMPIPAQAETLIPRERAVQLASDGFLRLIMQLLHMVDQNLNQRDDGGLFGETGAGMFRVPAFCEGADSAGRTAGSRGLITRGSMKPVKFPSMKGIMSCGNYRRFRQQIIRACGPTLSADSRLSIMMADPCSLLRWREEIVRMSLDGQSVRLMPMQNSLRKTLEHFRKSAWRMASGEI